MQLPDELPFEELLESACILQARHPPAALEPEARRLEREEDEQRRQDELRMRARRAARDARVAAGAGAGAGAGGARRLLRGLLRALPPRSLVLAGAAALLGVVVYYRPDLMLR